MGPNLSFFAKPRKGCERAGAYIRLNALATHNESLMVYYDPTPSSVTATAAAKVAVNALKTISVSSCLVGGLACRLHGNSRDANDVDLLVLSTYHSQEELKWRLVEIDSSFYTVASKNPTAAYRVL